MTRPGDRLRAFAARWCGAETLSRVVDPLIADLQAEHYAAQASGRGWLSRWIRIAGCVALLKVLALCGARRALLPWHAWPAEDRRAISRTASITAIGMMVTGVVIFGGPILTQLRHYPNQQSLIFYLLPQAMPIALAFGLTCGAFVGAGQGFAGVRVRASILTLALLCSVISFATTWWVGPNANQVFREAMYFALTPSDGTSPLRPPARGLAELTLPEFRERISAARTQGNPRLAADLGFRYQMRTALSFAPFALGLLAIIAVSGRKIRNWVLVAAAVVACSAYFFLLVWASSARYTLPNVLAAWLPNLVVGVVIGALIVHRAVSTKQVVAAR